MIILSFIEIMNWMFGLIGVVTGVFGIIYTWYLNKKSKELEKMNRSLSWAELQGGTYDLWKQFKGDYEPEVILAPNLRGGIIGHMIMDQYDTHIPVFVGLIFWRQNNGEIPPLPNHFEIRTGKWMLYIPKAIMDFKDKRLLIVDDFAMSGDTLAGVKQTLVDAGFNPDLIKTASLVTTKVAVANNKSADYKWKEAEDNNFYFPWGKAR